MTLVFIPQSLLKPAPLGTLIFCRSGNFIPDSDIVTNVEKKHDLITGFFYFGLMDRP
jgi:hypothetical protein